MANAIGNARYRGCKPERESTRKKFITTHRVDGLMFDGALTDPQPQGNAERWR
jgi:hypothetical protein